MKSILALVLLVVLSSGAAAAAAHESSKLAAQELSDYVRKATGRDLPCEVVIGTLDTLDNVPDGVRERLGRMTRPEASWTGFADGRLWFVGKEETAELYAVYRFLESRLGVRWFQAATKDDPGEYVPQLDRIELGPFSEFREPAFPIRRLDGTGIGAHRIPERAITCAVRNGFQVYPMYDRRILYNETNSPLYRFFAPRNRRAEQQLGGGHLTFVSAMPGGTCFKDHPEWFALVDGRRVQGATHMEQYCLSNPEVRRNVADRILRALAVDGGRGTYLFGQVDSPHGGCECAECRALDGPDEDRKGARPSRTTRFVKTVNEIAARVWAEYPEADLRMWAYLDYRALPQGVRPDSRLKLWFCPHGRCYAHALDDPKCARNVEMFDLLRGWQKLVRKVYLYDYLTCTPNLYTCNEAVEAHDIRLYRALGLIGWKNEAAFSDAAHLGKGAATAAERLPSVWQWLYVTGHLLWDPDLDETALLADAEAKYYGAAYPAMAKYQALRRKLWSETTGCMGYPTGDQRRPMLLERAGAKDELLGRLDEAERLAAGDAVRLSRIARDRKWLTEYWIGANEEMKAKRGLVFHVPKAGSAPVVDGDGGDAAWSAALFTDAFRLAYAKEPQTMPPDLTTSVGMLYDDANLHFLIDAKEPHPESIRNGESVWDGDGVEIFLFPPNIENKCYHLAVNPAGKVWGGTSPGGKAEGAFGATAAAKVLKDRYVIELTVPAERIFPIRSGETWRVQFGRNRTFGCRDGEAKHYSIDGSPFTDTMSFRSLSFGRPYLRNGTFDDLGQDGKPKGWEFPNGWSGTEKGPTGVSLPLVPPQLVQQTMWHGSLGQKPVPHRCRYAFTASGKGTVAVSFARYRDTPNVKAKYGYDRANLSPAGVGGTFAVDGPAKTFSGEYEIPADEWDSIRIAVREGKITLDSVTVEPL